MRRNQPTGTSMMTRQERQVRKNDAQVSLPNRRCYFGQDALAPFVLLLSILLFFSATLKAQDRNPETGLYELTASNIRLITDVPIDDELKSWPTILAQSLKHWQTYYNVKREDISELHATVYLIQDNTKFQSSGMLAKVPGFEEGYQFGSNLYVREQPSVYYRRHLFLHEANHWIMAHLYGGAGSPWFMEGMAEYQGTHLFRDGRLALGVIPQQLSDFPSWGRLRMINDTIADRSAPSLEQILAYENDRDRTKRYSWSWAACVFFANHPQYQPHLEDLYRTKLDYSETLSNQLRDRLEDRWDSVVTDWNGFISDLDVGYDLERSLVDGLDHAMNPTGKRTGQFQLATNRGWQSTGVTMPNGSKLRLKCSGRYRLRRSSGRETSWEAEPNGITIEYYRGNPLGCVLASIQPLIAKQETARWQTTRIGAGATLEAIEDGLLFLKVNEPSHELADNEGTIRVLVE
jgi:hypothetical protein